MLEAKIGKRKNLLKMAVKKIAPTLNKYNFSSLNNEIGTIVPI